MIVPSSSSWSGSRSSSESLPAFFEVFARLFGDSSFAFASVDLFLAEAAGSASGLAALPLSAVLDWAFDVVAAGSTFAFRFGRAEDVEDAASKGSSSCVPEIFVSIAVLVTFFAFASALARSDVLVLLECFQRCQLLS